MKLVTSKTFLKILLVLFVVSSLPIICLATDDAESGLSGGVFNLMYLTNQAGYGEFDYTNPQAVIALKIGAFIQIALSLLGVIFLVLTVYAGFLWMTAGGNEEQITKAKTMIRNSIIGLAIVISAYAITYFVVGWIGEGFYNTGLTVPNANTK